MKLDDLIQRIKALREIHDGETEVCYYGQGCRRDIDFTRIENDGIIELAPDPNKYL